MTDSAGPVPAQNRKNVWVARIALAVIAAAIGLYIYRSPAAENTRRGIVRMGRSLGRLVGMKDPNWKPIAVVIRELEQGDEIQRTRTIMLLRHDLTDPDEFEKVFPYLIRALKDESKSVREVTGPALEDLILRFGARKPGIAEPIASLLDDPSPTIRAFGARNLRLLAVSQQQDVPPPRLVACLDDDSEEVRAAAAETIVEYGQGTALFLPVAFRRLPNESPIAFHAFGRNLWNLRFPTSTLPLLIENLSSVDPLIRVSAATAINHMGRDAESARPAVMALLRKELDAQKSPQPPGPAEKTQVADKSHKARMSLPVDIIEQTSEALVQLSPDGDPLPGTVEILCEVLKCPKVQQQHAAAWSLGFLGRTAAPSVSLLISTFEAAPPTAADPRETIAQALAQIAVGTPDEARVIAVLTKAWNSAPQRQKAALARALWTIDPKADETVPELRKWTRDDTPSPIRRGHSPRSFLERPNRK